MSQMCVEKHVHYQVIYQYLDTNNARHGNKENSKYGGGVYTNTTPPI